MRKEDLIEGEVYSEILSGKNYISKHKSNRTEYYICPKTKRFTKDGLEIIPDENTKLATKEEKAWLELCIKEDRFISYEKFLESYSKEYFIVGKWYKCTCNNNYYKCAGGDNTDFNSSEVISPSGNDGFSMGYNNSGRDNHMGNLFKEYLTDLSEIQLYLPEGHPDKFKSNINSFREGDFIVCLEKPNGIVSYIKPNYIFEQYENSDSLSVRKDINGCYTCCSDVCFDLKSTWRYATQNEIKEYKRLGGPYDVTTKVDEDMFVIGKSLSEFDFVNKEINCYKDGEGLEIIYKDSYNLNEFKDDRKISRVTKDYFEVSGFVFGWFNKKEALGSYNLVETPKESLVGRYLQALVDYTNGGCVKRGEYGLIKTESLSCIDFPSQKSYIAREALTNGKFMLMPKGFTPNHQETKSVNKEVTFGINFDGESIMVPLINKSNKKPIQDIRISNSKTLII